MKKNSRNISTRNNNRTRSHIMKKRYSFIFSIGFVIAILICIFSLAFHTTISSASTKGHYEKCYKSIEVEKGDSLWSIANEYYTNDWKSVEDYMEEIKTFNGIENDTIHTGNYIAIPYYYTSNK